MDIFAARTVCPANEPWRSTTVIFALLVAVHLIVSAWLFPSLLTNAEAWAELGPNYVFHAYYSDLKTNLITRDFLYYPTMVRALMLLVRACGVPLSHAVFAMNVSAWIIVSLGNASLCFPYFRRWIESDAIRALLTLGILFHQNYFVRAPINIAYAAFLPFCLILADLPHIARFRLRRLLSLWPFLALTVTAKPIFIATIPSLAFHVAFGIRRSQKRLVALSSSLLFLVAGQLWLLDVHGAGGARAVNKLIVVGRAAVTMLWTFLYALGGRPFIYARQQNAKEFISPGGAITWLRAQPPLFIFMLCGSLLCTYQLVSSVRRQDQRLLWVTGAHFLVIGWLCATFVLSSVTFPPPREAADYIAREWYASALLSFFFIASMLAHSLRLAPSRSLSMVLWMMTSFPFGLGPLPKEPSWPCLHRSTWDVVARTPRLTDTGRTCATVNPIPWAMAGPNCQPLITPEPTDWGLLTAFRDQQENATFLAPSAAKAWEVDSVSFLLRANRPQSIRLIARNSKGHLISTATANYSTADEITIFIFDEPARSVYSVEIRGERNEPIGISIADRASHRPLWFWYGRPT